MSFLDSAVGALDTASGILGDKQGGGGAASDAATKYYKGDWIGNPPDGVGGATAPFDLRVQDTGKIIEFIHFGWAHGDYSSFFGHTAPVDDTAKGALHDNPPVPESRAVIYRAALERETLALSGFVASTQTVLADREQSTGSALDQLAGVADDLLGSGGDASSTAPKSGDLNSVNGKVKGIGQTLNSTNPVTYTETHKAGMDLHQARMNYRAVLAKVRTPPPPKKGLLSDISAIAGALPIAGDIFNIIQGIATKVFDIYVCIYAEFALEQELAIEKGCHDLTIDAIQQNKSPIFPVWFIKTDDSSSSSGDSGGAPQPPLLAMGTGQDNENLGDQLSEAPGKLKDAGEDAAAQAMHDFLEVPADNYWSQQYLTQALSPAVSKQDQGQPPAPPPSVGDIAAQTFATVLGVPVPSFAQDVISEIMQTTEEFLEAIYAKLLGWDVSQTISQGEVYEAARRRLLQKLVDLLVSKLSFLKSAEKSVGDTTIFKPPQGKEVKGDEALKKGEAFAMDEMTDKLAAGIDPILQFSMKDLAAKLDGFRSTAAAQNAMNMEVYLGRLPYLRALLFRNTFFPMWDLLVKEVFGSAGGPIQQFLNSSGAFFGGVKGPLDDVRDAAHRAKAVKDTLDQKKNVSVGTDGNIGDYKDAWDKGGAPADPPDPGKQQMEQDFPISGRSASAAGLIIVQDEWNGVSMVPDPQGFTDFPPAAAPPTAAAPAASSGLPSLASLF